ncbi:MAG: alpha/beta hydrolase [Bacteroidales bacterium]|nr:alpha/beta hydrolase [Bacteroidales bacterium]
MVLLWPEGKMPNSRGVEVHDSIARQRIWMVGQPRIYAFMATKSEQTGTSVLVIPGGGYVKQAYETAGITFAKWLNSLGINAFVLLHRNPASPDVEESSTVPTMDAQRAIKWIRSNATRLGIDPNRIGVMGCSAGGHVSACVSTVADDMASVGDSLDSVAFRPDFAILVSPVISMSDAIVHRGSKLCLLGKDRASDKTFADRWSMELHVNAQNPPSLMIHASDDPAVSPLNSVRFYEALMANGVKKSSLHIFPFGKHSIAVRNQPGSTAHWPQIAEDWMREIGVLK